MLAQNFKTPADLKISDAEFNALFKVLGMLERGELPHSNLPGAGKIQPHGFNMAEYLSETSCGTVGCIAGWAYVLSGKTVFCDVTGCAPFEDDRPMTGALDDLFHMNSSTFQQMLSVTPSQAAIALRNFLTHGQPRWDEALRA